MEFLWTRLVQTGLSKWHISILLLAIHLGHFAFAARQDDRIVQISAGSEHSCLRSHLGQSCIPAIMLSNSRSLLIGTPSWQWCILANCKLNSTPANTCRTLFLHGLCPPRTVRSRGSHATMPPFRSILPFAKDTGARSRGGDSSWKHAHTISDQQQSDFWVWTKPGRHTRFRHTPGYYCSNRDPYQASYE